MNSLKDTYRSVIRQIFNSCKAEDSGFQDESELYTQENDMHLILASGKMSFSFKIVLVGLSVLFRGIIRSLLISGAYRESSIRKAVPV